VGYRGELTAAGLASWSSPDIESNGTTNAGTDFRSLSTGSWEVEEAIVGLVGVVDAVQADSTSTESPWLTANFAETGGGGGVDSGSVRDEAALRTHRAADDGGEALVTCWSPLRRAFAAAERGLSEVSYISDLQCAVPLSYRCG
jgi:hypothetical protein